MRKMMWMACLCMLTTLIVGCNSGSETQKVAEKFMEAQKNEDVDAMFDLRESLYPSQSDDPYPDDRFLPLVDIQPNN